MLRLATLLLLAPLALLGDRIVLKDGKEYRGKFVDAEKGVVRFRVNSRVRRIPAADISRLEIAGTPSPDSAAGARRRTPVEVTAAPAPAVETTRQDTAPQPPFVTAPKVGTTAVNPIEGAAAIDSEYTRTGSETGSLGPAVGAHQPTADGRASVRVYSSGSIYWTPEGGAHALSGPILQSWLAQGGERSRLGYPISDEKVSNGGFTREQQFEGGRLTWMEKGGAVVEYRSR